MMKKVLLALLAVTLLGVGTTSAQAGWWRYRRAFVPVAPVVVRPAYVAPVYVARPVYVAPPIVTGPIVVPSRPIYRYNSYYAPTSVQVRRGSYYYPGGVQVRTPGLGLSISY